MWKRKKAEVPQKWDGPGPIPPLLCKHKSGVYKRFFDTDGEPGGYYTYCKMCDASLDVIIFNRKRL